MELAQECTRYNIIVLLLFSKSIHLVSLLFCFVLFCSQGGSTQTRFQPRVGKYLAASSANVVSVLDVETQACRHSLQV